MKHDFGTITVKAEINGEQEGQKIESKSDVLERYRSLGEELKERLYALFLTNSNELIGDKVIGVGSRDGASLDVQDIVRTAALVNAGAVILVHNHPSGRAGATDQDIKATNQVDEALENIDVELLDHVIISRDDSHSMRRVRDGPF